MDPKVKEGRHMRIVNCYYKKPTTQRKKCTNHYWQNIFLRTLILLPDGDLEYSSSNEGLDRYMDEIDDSSEGLDEFNFCACDGNMGCD